MAITQAMCTSFKVEILKAVHNFTASSGNTFNLALYTSSASQSWMRLPLPIRHRTKFLVQVTPQKAGPLLL